MNKPHLMRRKPVRRPGILTVTASTSESIASIAARGLQDPGSLTHREIKSVCASSLSQHG